MFYLSNSSGASVIQGKTDHIWSVPLNAADDFIHSLLDRRLDNRIRETCERAATVELDDQDIAAIKQELLVLMHQRINRMRSQGPTVLDESLVTWHRA